MNEQSDSECKSTTLKARGFFNRHDLEDIKRIEIKLAKAGDTIKPIYDPEVMDMDNYDMIIEETKSLMLHSSGDTLGLLLKANGESMFIDSRLIGRGTCIEPIEDEQTTLQNILEIKKS